MNIREILVFSLICLVWGLHFVVIKVAVSEIPPIFYAAIRMTLVAALLSPFLRWRHGQMRRVVAAGAGLGAFNYLFMFTGISHATATTSALAMELYVPFATILSVVFLGEQVGIRCIIGITMAFIGVGVIALGKGEIDVSFGVALVAFGALCDASGAVVLKKIEGFKPIQLLAWFFVVGTLCLWAGTLMLESQQIEAYKVGDQRIIIGAVLYSAIGSSIIGHTCYYWLLQRLPLSIIAPSGLMVTLLAVIFANVFLKEALTKNTIIGRLMIMIGVGIVILRSNRKNKLNEIHLTC